MVNGITGILLGLLFGWMLGRPRGPMARIADRADKQRREMLRRKCEVAKSWEELVQQIYGSDTPDPTGGYTLEDEISDKDYVWQEPDADQSAIIRSGCTCGTSDTTPCPFHDSWQLSSSGVAQRSYANQPLCNQSPDGIANYGPTTGLGG